MSRAIFKSMLSAALLTISASAIADVEVKEGFVRDLLPGKQITAAFMTIENTSDKDLKLVSASLPEAKKVEIHTHSHQGGVMRMRQIESIDIAANSSAKLAPGGLHLMLFGVKALKQNAEITLCFDDNQCQQVTLPVKQQ